MRRVLVALLSVTSLSIAGIETSNAADMAVKAPLARVAPAPAWSWSGVYIGGHIGGGWGDQDVTDQGLIGFILGVPAVQNVKTRGFLGGLQAGWNYQIGRLVVGNEVEFSWSNVRGSSTFAPLSFIGIIPIPASSITRDIKTNWIGTATARTGLTVWGDRGLLYGKAGVAWARNTYTDSAILLGATAYTSSQSDTRTGWTVGTGFEWSFMDNWSAKIEYDYLDFGRRTIGLAPAGGIFPVALEIDQRIQEVKFGLNYRFMPLP
jgi:outer membrane immunogenic protein